MNKQKITRIALFSWMFLFICTLPSSGQGRGQGGRCSAEQQAALERQYNYWGAMKQIYDTEWKLVVGPATAAAAKSLEQMNKSAQEMVVIMESVAAGDTPPTSSYNAADGWIEMYNAYKTGKAVDAADENRKVGDAGFEQAERALDSCLTRQEQQRPRPGSSHGGGGPGITPLGCGVGPEEERTGINYTPANPEDDVSVLGGLSPSVLCILYGVLC